MKPTVDPKFMKFLLDRFGQNDSEANSQSKVKGQPGQRTLSQLGININASPKSNADVKLVSAFSSADSLY